MIRAQIEQKLRDTLHPEFLEVHNDSEMHQENLGDESHMRVNLVSQEFDGMKLLQRHRMVQQIIKEEQAQIHALVLNLMTPAEWEARGGRAINPPPCANH